jgi:CheY-like chemotaxis protein
MAGDTSAAIIEDKRIVLAVDDQAVILTSIKTILQDDFDVRLSKSGKWGLLMLHIFDPDIILLDIEMPDLSGFEFIKYLRNDLEKKDIPVVLVTSQLSEEYIKKAAVAGANGYLTKPVVPKVLKDKIAQALAARTGPVKRNVDPDAAMKAALRAEYVNELIKKMLNLKDACKVCKTDQIMRFTEELRRKNFGANFYREIEDLYELAINYDYPLMIQKISKFVIAMLQ